MKSSLVAAAFLAATVSAHGNITSPAARLAGPAMAVACGQNAVNTVLQDGTIPLEDLANVPATCQLNLCRGAVFQDNVARVQQFSPGQVVPFKAVLPIPHEGPANVSIVKTATNTVLGSPLLVFDTYADEKLAALPANNTAFAVTIPTTLAAATDCRVAGECVLQWFWFGTAARQTYESCVDFVIGAAAAGVASAASGVSSSLPSANTLVPASSAASGGFATASAAFTAISTPGSFSIIPVDSSGPASSSSTEKTPAPTTKGPVSPTEAPIDTPTTLGEQPASTDRLATPAEMASVPIPSPAEAVDGSFGGTAGLIPLVSRRRRSLRQVV